MMWTTTSPRSTSTHSPDFSPSMPYTREPSSLMRSCTRSASARTWRLESPLAITTRSNMEGMRAVLNTMMSRPLTSSSASTTARCLARMSIRGGAASGVEPMSHDIACHRRRHHVLDALAALRARADLARRNGHRVHRNEVHLSVQRDPRPPEHADAREAPDLVGTVPAVELRVLIRAHQEMKLRVSELAAQRLKRVDREARGVRMKLALVHTEPRLVLDREAQHRRPIPPGRCRRKPVACPPCRDEKHIVEPEVIEGGPRHREVRVVNRVERAAEDSYGSH